MWVWTRKVAVALTFWPEIPTLSVRLWWHIQPGILNNYNNGTHHSPFVHHTQAPPYDGLYGDYSQAMESSSSEHEVDHLVAVGQFYKLMFEQAHPADQLSASKFSAKGGVCASRTMVTTCVLPIFTWKSVSSTTKKKKKLFLKDFGASLSVLSVLCDRWSCVAFCKLQAWVVFDVSAQEGAEDENVPEIFNRLIPSTFHLSLCSLPPPVCRNRSSVAEDSGNPGCAKQTRSFFRHHHQKKKSISMRATDKLPCTHTHTSPSKTPLLRRLCSRRSNSPIRLVESLTTFSSGSSTKEDIKIVFEKCCLPNQKGGRGGTIINAVWHRNTQLFLIRTHIKKCNCA